MSADPFLWIFIIFLPIFFTWLIFFVRRAAIVTWMVRRAVANGKISQADQIIAEARLQHWISLKEEAELRNEYQIPLVGDLSPESRAPDLRQYFTDLFHFYFPRRNDHD